MAKIKISELRPAGSELFQDSESFLNELQERETSDLLGGYGGFYNMQNNDQFTQNLFNNQQASQNFFEFNVEIFKKSWKK